MEAQLYFKIEGPDLNKEKPWCLNVMRYFEELNYPGYFGITSNWKKPKYFSTLKELITYAETLGVHKELTNV